MANSESNDTNKTKYAGLNSVISLVQNIKDNFSLKSHTHTMDDVDGTLPITKGGTGANTASDARSNLGAAPTEHTHELSDVTDITAKAYEVNYLDGVTSSVQAQLDSKSPLSHTHSSATTDVDGFMSAEDKMKLNGIYSGAQVNQNAFSYVSVDSTVMAADNSMDTLRLTAGSNVEITPDVASDNITISAMDTTYSLATNEHDGLMGAEDKIKLDGIESGANNFVLVAASQNRLGGVTTTSTVTGTDGLTPSPIINGVPYYKDSEYSVVTEDGAGLMSAEDKIKLDNIEAEANKIIVDSVMSSTSSNPVQNSTVYNALTSKSGVNHKHKIADVTDVDATVNELNYVSGVTAPIQTQINSKSDINHIHGDVTADDSGFMSAADKVKLDSVAFGANQYNLPTASATTLGGIKVGENLSMNSGVLSASDTTYSVASTSIDGLMSAADKTKLNGIATGANKTVVDDVMSSSSTNPVQNKVINNALASKVPGNRTINGKQLTYNITLTASDVGAEESGTVAAALSDAKSYTDTKVSDLINGAPSTLDTLGEIADAMTNNQDVVEALDTAIGSKANASDLSDHINDRSNPHGVTLGQLGISQSPEELDAMESKLDGIAENANNYTLPVAGSSVIGGVTTTSTVTNTDGLTPSPIIGGVPYYKDTNTTYGNVSASKSGLMTPDLLSKLNGVEIGANNYVLPTASTTLGGVKTTSTVTSTTGLIACPIIGGVPYYKDTNTTYTLATFGVTATAAELNYVKGVTSAIQTQLNNKAAVSHGTHVTYSSDAPKAGGSPTAGSAATVARSDHVHPAQVDIVGNAATATKADSADYATSAGSADSAITATYAKTFLESGTVYSTTDWDTLEPGMYRVGQSEAFSDAYHSPVGAYTWGELYITYAGSVLTQVYISHSSEMYYRQRWGDINAFGAWAKAITDQNYTEYTPSKTGSGASGTWGIDVSGNAATTTKLKTARTLSLTGDVSGSATFDGSSNTNIAVTVADNSHEHSADNITTGVLPMTRGGTGATSIPEFCTNIGLTANIHELNSTQGIAGNIQTQLDGKADKNHVHDNYLDRSGGTMNGILAFADNQGIYGTMAGGSDNWSLFGAGSDDQGSLVLSVRDNALEDVFKIVFENYTGDVYTPFITHGEESTFNSNVIFNGAMIGNLTGNADTASKLGTSLVGSDTQPIYLDNGSPKACAYTVGKTVPSAAVFTDTKYAVSDDGEGNVVLTSTVTGA